MEKRKSNTGTMIACALLAVVMAAGGAAAGWFLNVRFGGSKPASETSDMGGMVVTDGDGTNGIKLTSAEIAAEDYAEYGVSEQAESAFQITATITPDDATNTKLDWTAEFVDMSDPWTAGKSVNDYVTISTETDGATVATVECKQAFGETIRITATSRVNASATDSMICEYVKRLDDITVSTDMPTNSGGTIYVMTNGTDYDLTITPVYSVGTVDAYLTITDVRLKLTEDFRARVSTHMPSLDNWQYNAAAVGLETDIEANGCTLSLGAASAADAFITYTGTGNGGMYLEMFNEGFAEEILSGSAPAVIEIDYTYAHTYFAGQSTTVTTGTKTLGAAFDQNIFNIPVNGLDMDQEVHLF